MLSTCVGSSRVTKDMFVELTGNSKLAIGVKDCLFHCAGCVRERQPVRVRRNS